MPPSEFESFIHINFCAGHEFLWDIATSYFCQSCSDVPVFWSKVWSRIVWDTKKMNNIFQQQPKKPGFATLLGLWCKYMYGYCAFDFHTLKCYLFLCHPWFMPGVPNQSIMLDRLPADWSQVNREWCSCFVHVRAVMTVAHHGICVHAYAWVHACMCGNGSISGGWLLEK